MGFSSLSLLEQRMFFRTTADDQLDGMAAMFAEDLGPYEVTFEAPSLEAAVAFVEEHNLDEASSWSDTRTFLSPLVERVDAPGEYHLA